MSSQISRRNFYNVFINLMGAAMTAVLALPAAAYLLLKPKSAAEEDLVEIGDIGQLPVGRPKEVVYFRTRIDGWKRVREKTSAWLVKTSETSVTAFSPQCTHLGCAYHWESDNKNFLCPCHTSVFDAEGKVVSGPAPRPLDRYVAKIEGGKILLSSEIEKA